jgi:hypothetical protein
VNPYIKPEPAPDPYVAWREATRNFEPERIPKHCDLSPGFYRHSKTAQPVAIWLESDGMYRGVGDDMGGRPVTPTWDESTFSQCEAVPEKEWRKAVDTGVWWDFRRVGDNRPDDNVASLRMEIENIHEKTNDLFKCHEPMSEADAIAAANLKARLVEIDKMLTEVQNTDTLPLRTKIHEIEKQRRPIQVELDAVLATYNQLRTMAGRLSKQLVYWVEPYLIAQRKAQKAAGDVLNTRGGKTRPAPTNIGPTGAKIGLKTVWAGKIVDYDLALAAFKDNPKVHLLIQELANAAARSTAKTPVPGVEFIEKDKAQ